jgi:hypothetical protein
LLKPGYGVEIAKKVKTMRTQWLKLGGAEGVRKMAGAEQHDKNDDFPGLAGVS